MAGQGAQAQHKEGLSDLGCAGQALPTRPAHVNGLSASHILSCRVPGEPQTPVLLSWAGIKRQQAAPLEATGRIFGSFPELSRAFQSLVRCIPGFLVPSSILSFNSLHVSTTSPSPPRSNLALSPSYKDPHDHYICSAQIISDHSQNPTSSFPPAKCLIPGN